MTASILSTPLRRGKGYWLRLAVFAVLAFLAEFLVVFEIVYARAMVLPAPSEPCCATPADYGLAFTEVAFTAADGTPLSAWWIPSRNRAAVILLHGYGANRTEMLPRAAALSRRGFGALVFDLRGHGRSGGSVRAFGWPDLPDLSAAVDFAISTGEVDSKRIGVFGFSIGGQIAVRGAAADRRIRALMADDPTYVSVDDLPSPTTLSETFLIASTMTDLRMVSLFSGVSIPDSMTATLPRVSPTPLFLVASGKEPLVLRLQRGFFSHAGEPKDFWPIADAGHGEGFLLYPEEYSRRMAEFFSSALLR